MYFNVDDAEELFVINQVVATVLNLPPVFNDLSTGDLTLLSCTRLQSTNTNTQAHTQNTNPAQSCNPQIATVDSYIINCLRLLHSAHDSIKMAVTIVQIFN